MDKQLTHKDLRSDTSLADLGFRPEDIEHYKGLTFSYFNMLVDYDKAVESKDFSTQLDIEAELPRLKAEIQVFGVNPKQANLDAIKYLARHPDMSALVDDPIVQKYKERVSSPATGIRAFCIQCQGGSTTGVTECAAVNCPLYFFRDGRNPLFGRVLPPANFLEIEGDDVGDINESEDSGDAE